MQQTRNTKIVFRSEGISYRERHIFSGEEDYGLETCNRRTLLLTLGKGQLHLRHPFLLDFIWFASFNFVASFVPFFTMSTLSSAHTLKLSIVVAWLSSWVVPAMYEYVCVCVKYYSYLAAWGYYQVLPDSWISDSPP